MNFDAVSKNAKILKIGPVEPKLRKIRQIVMGEIRRDTVLYNTACRRDTVLYNTVSRQFFPQYFEKFFLSIRFFSIKVYYCVFHQYTGMAII